MGVIAPPSGIRDRWSPSFPPPFLLPAHRKLSQPPPTYPSPPLSLPALLAQQLSAAQLPAAGAGEVVGGEGGEAQLDYRGWPTWGSVLLCAL